ncbi:MAG TPA: DUF4127 family protein [Patescibacteria group bacterium]|nr:DUF4127 family protein [Patescibacteria group bacterium]
MPTHFFRYFFLILMILAVTAAVLIRTDFLRYAEPLALQSPPPAKHRVVLVPLDTRPACIDYVTSLSGMADMEIIQPPVELMDNYLTPANRPELRAWLKDACRAADYAIISTDSLVHGGLMASRLPIGNAEDYQNTLQLLREIHAENPSLQLHVFNIIPRLLVPDQLYDQTIRENILAFSILKDKASRTPLPEELEQLKVLETTLPPEVIQRYLNLYQQNDIFNSDLIKLTEAGVLQGLIIGQDDGQPFGLPNGNKLSIEKILAARPQLADRVISTRGTDEVALTQMARLANQQAPRKLRVHVIYSDPSIPDLIMPYMPHSVARTVEEKLKLLRCEPANSLWDADFILYIHIGRPDTPDLAATLHQTSLQVQQLLASGRPLALVDLSENFTLENTLLPTLIQDKANIARLTAYAGWNTSSNSIGTALAQSTLFLNALHRPDAPSRILELYETNLNFLVRRFLEDGSFQLETFPFVNQALRQAGNNPLQLGDDRSTDEVIRRLTSVDADYLFRRGLHNQIVSVMTADGPRQLLITSLQTDTTLPWRRLFEIRLRTTLSLAEINP